MGFIELENHKWWMAQNVTLYSKYRVSMVSVAYSSLYKTFIYGEDVAFAVTRHNVKHW